MSPWDLGLGPPGLLVGYRMIRPGDEVALRPSEDVPRALPAVRRASGAARMAARCLLAQLGHGDVDIPRASDGAPRWPPGIVGSLSHDGELAIAVVGPAPRFVGTGIDVEANVALPVEIAGRIANRGEEPTTTLFSIKEAVFKAVNPIDGVFLDFADIDVDLVNGTAKTATGYQLRFAVTQGPYVVALAWL